MSARSRRWDMTARREPTARGAGTAVAGARIQRPALENPCSSCRYLPTGKVTQNRQGDECISVAVVMRLVSCLLFWSLPVMGFGVADDACPLSDGTVRHRTSH